MASDEEDARLYAEFLERQAAERQQRAQAEQQRERAQQEAKDAAARRVQAAALRSEALEALATWCQSSGTPFPQTYGSQTTTRSAEVTWKTDGRTFTAIYRPSQAADSDLHVYLHTLSGKRDVCTDDKMAAAIREDDPKRQVVAQLKRERAARRLLVRSSALLGTAVSIALVVWMWSTEKGRPILGTSAIVAVILGLIVYFGGHDQPSTD